MDYIKGKYRNAIFSSDSGYKVGLFRVKEASDSLSDLKNKTITFTGYFHELNTEDTYIFNGKYIYHERYGYQFQVSNYERVEPTGIDATLDFLTSSFVKGCGEKTAKKIVESLGDDALKLIKEDKNNLINIGLNEKTTEKIYSSIMSYYNSDELIMYLKSLDFSVKEITKMLSLYGNKIKNILDKNLYSLVDFIDFNKLDKVYFKLNEETNDMRIFACIIEGMKRKCFINGDTYLYQDEILSILNTDFKIDLSSSFSKYIDELKFQGEIKVIDKRYYLMEDYLNEENIASSLYEIDSNNTDISKSFDIYLEDTEKEFNIKYNEEQKKAIKSVLENSVSIITGGPGTGKTTIINGLLRVYQNINHYRDIDMNRKVALLAPTGRASKRLSETTNYGASTIHRYLKWNHETKEFGINEYNKTNHELIIVDEVSMVDTELMSSLLKGISHDAKLVLVGDSFQLPSVSSGDVLKDLISSDMFSHVCLNNIYRQSENSFIPILASEIKNVDIVSDITLKKDDFNFLECKKEMVKPMLKNIIKKCIDKGIKEKDIQVLAPMYKGENGIDNLNIILQDLFNPYHDGKTEVHIGPIIYRINDKVINLVNNIDQNIFNGDIGYIKEINMKKPSEFMKIDFYGNLVTIKREDISQIKHAYAMSIHKSQGSEFNHVIIPLTNEFNRMLYNKLLYTGVSRAKKSLVLMGSEKAFFYAVNNSYSIERKTSLKEFIMNKYN